jgi:hypothetical protein
LPFVLSRSDNAAFMAVARLKHAPAEETPLPPMHDPVAMHAEFRRHRRRRFARIEHRLEVKRAKRRFWILICALFMFALFLGVTIWEQIQSMFGI